MLLRESFSSFEFQGRTELAPNSNATVFSVFAIRDGDDKVKVSYGYTVHKLSNLRYLNNIIMCSCTLIV